MTVRMLRLLSAALLFVLFLLPSACASTAQFHSRTGQNYARLALKAVPCDEGDVQALQAAGGVPIGTIDAKALTVTASADDVADEATRVAAKRGGTHVLLTGRGEESFTYVQPGQERTQCQKIDGVLDCQRSFTPPTQTTVHEPTASFVVFRVPRQNWAQLPEGLRPVAAVE
jgi:hypothetical protein